MRPSRVLCVLLLCILLLSSSILHAQRNRYNKFQPKAPPKKQQQQQQQQQGVQYRLLGQHSFQSPFLFGTTSGIPFWEYGGAAVATDNFVRLVPAIRSRVGWMWNTEPLQTNAWEATLEFNVHNTQSPGADGLAFWLSRVPKKTGSLFGQAEDFEGLGIIFDTYDNNANGDNPSIIAVLGKGNKGQKWDYDNDLKANQLDRCRADFRNNVNGNTKVKVVYSQKVLQVLVDNHGSGDFSFCFAVDNVNIPTGYYFGLTAATGGLADYHDVYSLVVRDLNQKEEEETPRHGRKGWRNPYEYLVDEQKKNEAAAAEQQQAAGTQAAEKPMKSELAFDDVLEPAKQQKKKQPTKKRNKKQEKKKDDVAVTDDDEHAFFEALRDKLKNFGITDDKKPESKPADPNTPTAATTTATNAPTDLMQQNAQLHHMDIQALQQQGLLVLEALEEVSKTVKSTSTKNDIDGVLDRVNGIADRQAQVQTSLSDLRDGIRREVTALMDGLREETQSLGNEVKRLETMLNTLFAQVGDISSQHNRFRQDFERSSDEVKETIKKESSLGFWTFFILFQIVFAACVVYYRAYRDQKNYKLY